MLKCDFHMHAAEDPMDYCRHGVRDLIEKAAALKFDVLAFTFHGCAFNDPAVTALARERGILLISGCELFVERCEVLCLNITQEEVDEIKTFEDLRAWKKAKGEAGLIIAPHPFFPLSQCLRHECLGHMDLWDAIEYCHMHLRWLNFNREAERVAREHGLPLVGTSDAHELFMFGTNHTLVDAEKEMLSVFRAIRAGKVRYYAPPLSVWRALKVLAFMQVWERLGRVLTTAGRAKQAARRLRRERAERAAKA